MTRYKTSPQCPRRAGAALVCLVAVAVAVSAAACGSTTPTSPSSAVASSSAFHGVVIDTVNGGAVAGVTITSGSGGRVSVSAPGYLTHDNVVSSAATIDLIPTAAPFDLDFYRQLARGSLEGPVMPLRVLSASPSIYLQTTGVKRATVTSYQTAAQQVIPAMSGGRLHLATWATGDEVRPDADGWIIVELVNDAAAPCGRTLTGASAGHMWLNTTAACRQRGDIVPPATQFAHELGHALGFSHVAAAGTLMNAAATQLMPSDVEQYHAVLAYRRHAGNRDLDVDP